MVWVILDNLLSSFLQPFLLTGREGGGNTSFFQGIQVDPETKNGMGNSIKLVE